MEVSGENGVERSMNTNIEAVIVDLDGTLVTIDERFCRVFNDVLKRFGRRRISKRSFLNKFHSNKLYYFPFGPHRRNGQKTACFWRAFLMSYGQRRYAKHSHPIKGALKAVESIKRRGIKVAVVTGRICPPSSVRRELQGTGINRHVDIVVTKAIHLRSFKPNQTTSRATELSRALKRLRKTARECLFVADYVEDIRSARPLGIITVAVLSGSSSLNLLKRAKPDYVIDSIRQLPRLIESRFGGL